MDITLTKQQIRDAAQQAYNYGAKLTGGANADYIPYLANIDPTLFGLSVMLPDGTAINLGDTDYKFGIESVSKVPTAILAMRQQSPAAVLDKIGADATGLPFSQSSWKTTTRQPRWSMQEPYRHARWLPPKVTPTPNGRR